MHSHGWIDDDLGILVPFAIGAYGTDDDPRGGSSR